MKHQPIRHKPIKKTKYIEVEYWDCGTEGHTHRKEKTAKRCVAGNKELRKWVAVRVKKKARAIYAATGIIHGRTYKSLAKELKVSSWMVSTYVFHVIHKARYDLNNLNYEIIEADTIPDMRKHKDYHLRLIAGVADHWGVPECGYPYVKGD